MYHLSFSLVNIYNLTKKVYLSHKKSIWFPISYYYTETSPVISSRQHFRHDSQESQLNSFLSVDKQKKQELY